jgi:hypothetical protein
MTEKQLDSAILFCGVLTAVGIAMAALGLVFTVLGAVLP